MTTKLFRYAMTVDTKSRYLIVFETHTKSGGSNAQCTLKYRGTNKIQMLPITRKMSWILLVTTLLLVKSANAQQCVWYDQCGDDPEFNDGAHNLNCVYNGPPGN